MLSDIKSEGREWSSSASSEDSKQLSYFVSVHFVNINMDFLGLLGDSLLRAIPGGFAS